MTVTAITLADLAERLGVELAGDPQCVITGLAPLASAKAGQLSFLDNPRYRQQLSHTNASAVILRREELPHCPSNALISNNPYLSYAQLTAWFATAPQAEPGVHPTVVCGTADIAASASIGAHCVIGNHVRIAEGVVIQAGCVIGDNCVIGANSHLYSQVTLYHDVVLGEGVIIHSGAVLGSDGFGFAKTADGWQKIVQLGGVRIGNAVEIGANTTIDRGALDNTVIEDQVKLDNQIQIGHNVHIGRGTAIAGCVGIAGSTRIGQYCLIAGGAGIGGHLTIADYVVITGMAMVTKSITQAGSYSSGTGLQESQEWRKSAARFHQLNQLAHRIQQLEAKVQQLSQQQNA